MIALRGANATSGGRSVPRSQIIVASAYAATVRATVAILTAVNAQITTMEEQVEAHFGQHPDAEIYLSQPALGVVLGAWVLAEFGDDNTRYANARSRRNYAGTSPITRKSGKSIGCLDPLEGGVTGEGVEVGGQPGRA